MIEQILADFRPIGNGVDTRTFITLASKFRVRGSQNYVLGLPRIAYPWLRARRLGHSCDVILS
jgi:hypothetical protein